MSGLPESTSIDIGSATDLQFQEFPVSTSTSDRSAVLGVTSTDHHLSKTWGVHDTSDNLLGHGSGVNDKSMEEEILFGEENKRSQQQQDTSSILELAFFAKYFDISSTDVFSRIVYSVLPFSSGGSTTSNSRSFAERFIRSNPDLYGPFWINVTLIFCIAICGNIANYFSSMDPDSWHYDFTKVGLAASTVFSYVIAVPVGIWFLFWFRGCTAMFSLLETICTYGYSMSIYVPISILWVVCPPIVQFILVIMGGLLSGGVLSLSFSPVVKSDPSTTVNFSYLILFLIMGIHSLLAFTFWYSHF
jgi:hypothetical protein